MNYGRLTTPFKGFIYGTEAVGKSSIAASAPRPIFFDLEDGTARLDVARYSFHDGPSGHIPTCYQDVLDGIYDLIQNEHTFQTLVVDSMSSLEPLIWQHILERDSSNVSEINPRGRKLESIEAYGYGKGYQMAMEEGKAFLAALDTLRSKRGMNVLLIGHAHVKNFRNPSGEDFDRYIPRLHEKIAGKISEWVDFQGFAMFEEGALGKDGKGVSTGRRLIYFNRRASWDAKSRYALPEYVEISESDPWSKIGAAISYATSAPLGQIEADIEVELERIADETLTATVRAAIAKLETTKQGDASKVDKARNTLTAYLNRLRTK